MPSYEIYYPQNPDSDPYQKVNDKDEGKTQGLRVTPQLEASVNARASIDLELTPQINIGIKVGKEKGWLKDVVDAQIVGFMNNTLSFNVAANAEAHMNEAGKGASAQFEVWISYFYNLGYGAKASLKYFFNFHTDPRNIWGGRGKEIVLWKRGKKVSTAQRLLPVFLDDGPNSTIGLDKNWYSSFDDRESNNQSAHKLRKSLDYADIAAFGKGLLECNDGGSTNQVAVEKHVILIQRPQNVPEIHVWLRGSCLHPLLVMMMISHQYLPQQMLKSNPKGLSTALRIYRYFSTTADSFQK